jgi:hypothetical protein
MLLFFGLFSLPACLLAQTADKYFHNSAKLYIENKKDQALSMLDEGIRKYPNDSSLIKLRARIELPPPPPPPKQKEQQKPPEQQKQQEAQLSQKKLSKEEAERMLRFLMEQEKKKPRTPVFDDKPVKKVPPEKDW